MKKRRWSLFVVNVQVISHFRPSAWFRTSTALSFQLVSTYLIAPLFDVPILFTPTVSRIHRHYYMNP